MRSFGNLNMQQNKLQQMAIDTESNFPDSPVPGRFVFKDKILYLCADIIDGVPAWIPLTNEISTYVHFQNSSSTTWEIYHKLSTVTPAVQVYDSHNTMVIPDAIDVVDNTRVRVSFGTPVAGRAVVLTGNDDGVDRSTSAGSSFTHTQTDLQDTWVISHNLGYYPIVRVFIGDYEVVPDGIQHTSVFETVVTFTSPQTGVARLV